MSYVTEVLADSPSAYFRLSEASGNFIDQIAALVATPQNTTADLSYRQTAIVNDDNGTSGAMRHTSGNVWESVPSDARLSRDATQLNKFSFEFWFKTSSTPTGSAGPLVKGFTSHNDPFYEWAFHYNSTTGNLRITIATTSTFASNGFDTGIAWTTGVADGAWHHWVVTYDGANIKVYKDGSLAASIARTGNMNAYATALGIGDILNLGGGFGMTGFYDELAIYNNQALSAARVLAHFNAASAVAAPANTVAPAVTGTAQVGSTLSTTTGTWTGTPTSFAYQWQRGGTNIGGATSSTYVLVDADDGANVRCVVTATNAGGSASANSNAVAVTEPAPTNSVAPTVSGSAPVGSTLTAAAGTWAHMAGAGAHSFAYQWTRDGSNIGGATSSTYVTVSADAGHAVGVKVTATNTGGSSSAVASSNTVTVTQTPTNTVAPAVTGTAVVGSVLTTDNGTWSAFPAITGYAYQWQRGGANIGGATSSTYTLVDADDGTSVRCVVTATSSGGSASANSNAVAVTEPSPTNSVAPSVSGSAPVGNVLTAAPGTWAGMAGAGAHSFAYQWTRDGANIGGATASTYTTVSADVGHAVSVKVTATNTGGSSSAVAASNSISVTQGPANTVAPAVTGTAVVGSVLTTTDGTWTGSPAPTFAYQWQRNGANIAGQTASTHTLVDADDGQSVRCVVTATNSVGSTAANSNAVVPAEPAPSDTVAPSVSGATQVGSVLTASPGTWDNMAGAGSHSFSYQWTRDGTNIAGATAATRTTTSADVGHSLSVKVTATNTGGSAGPVSASNSITVTEIPVNTVLPVITGSPVVGSVLTCSDGTWDAYPAATFSYQWQRDAVDIAGATANTRALTDADDGANVGCIVTATNAGGSANEHASVVAVTEPAPANTAQPHITGSALSGSTLTATPGTWDHMAGAGGSSFAYQWTRDGADIAGATSPTYATAPADDDREVTVKVTATNTGGSATAIASNSIHVDQPPTLIVAPVLSGHARSGGALSCSTGVWSAAPDPTFAFQWQTSADELTWADLPGETRVFHSVPPAEAGLFVRCVVTATNVVGSTDAPSRALLVQGGVWRPDSLDPFYLARLPFKESQAGLSFAVAARGKRTVAVGWHGTAESPERGSFALVRVGGPLEDLIGHVILVTTAERARARQVFAFVHSASDTVQDLTLTRQLFQRVSVVGERIARCTVEVAVA